MRIFGGENIVLNHQGVRGVYNVLPTDDVLLCNAIDGVMTVNLPTPSVVMPVNTPFTVMKIDTSANTINVASGALINGAATYTLTNQFNVAQFFTDGATWYVVVPTNSNSSQDCLQVTLSAAQMVVSGVPTLVAFDVVAIDTQNAYNNGTYTYKPKKAGWYRVNFQIKATVLIEGDHIDAYIYKNGVMIPIYSSLYAGTANQIITIALSQLIQVNGTTDTIQLWADVEGSSFYKNGTQANIEFVHP